MRELDCRTVADETLPPFEPEARPIAVQTHASQPHRAAREERFELAESIPGAMSEEQTDAKLYPGAYAKGWRVFAKDDQGHFHYRISTYRFTSRRGAPLRRRPERRQRRAVATGAPPRRRRRRRERAGSGGNPTNGLTADGLRISERRSSTQTRTSATRRAR